MPGQAGLAGEVHAASLRMSSLKERVLLIDDIVEIGRISGCFVEMLE